MHYQVLFHSAQCHNSNGSFPILTQLQSNQINTDYAIQCISPIQYKFTIFKCRSKSPHSQTSLFCPTWQHFLQSISIFLPSPFLPLRGGLIKSPRQPPLFNRCQLLIRDFQIFLQTSPFGHHSLPPP